MALSYSKSCLIGAIMESLAYGIYFTYFLQSLRVLRKKLVNGRVSIWLSLTTIVLFVLITMRLVLDNKAAVEAFTDDPITPNAAEIYFTSFGNGALFRTGTYIALTIVADIFIVYRVFVVWANSFFVAAVPSLLAIADIVSGGLVLQTIRNLKAGESPDGAALATHIMIFYGFTLGLNVLSTLLIALRIYLAQRQAEKAKVVPSTTLQMTMTIVVESAVLYSGCLIAMLVPTATGSNVQYCLLSAMPGVVGLAFSLIIVRAGSGQAPHNTLALPRSSIHFASRDTYHGPQTHTTDRTVTTTATDLTRSEAATSSTGMHGGAGGIQVHFQSGRSVGNSTRSNFDVFDMEDVEKQEQQVR